MLVQFNIYPMDETHMSNDVARMMKILEQSGVEYRLGPMATAEHLGHAAKQIGQEHFLSNA